MMRGLLLTSYERFGCVGMDEYKEMFIDEMDKDEISLSDYSEYLRENYPDNDFFPMESFDEIMDGTDPWKIARSCFYGDFRPCDDWFRFNGYGNLESMDEWKIRKEMESDRDF